MSAASIHNGGNMLDAINEVAEHISAPSQLTDAICELVLSLWEDSDQEADTLVSLIGGIATAQWRLMSYIGDSGDGG